MNKTQGSGIFKDIHMVSLAGFLLMFTFFLLNHQMIFPNHWFPSHFAASTFTILFCAWILSEFINSMWSRKNSQSANKSEVNRNHPCLSPIMSRDFQCFSYATDLSPCYLISKNCVLTSLTQP